MLQNHPGLSKRRAERTYAQKASDAWMDTIYQCLRIFLLNRVTPKAPGEKREERSKTRTKKGEKPRPGRKRTARSGKETSEAVAET